MSIDISALRIRLFESPSDKVHTPYDSINAGFLVPLYMIESENPRGFRKQCKELGIPYKKKPKSFSILSIRDGDLYRQAYPGGIDPCGFNWLIENPGQLSECSYLAVQQTRAIEYDLIDDVCLGEIWYYADSAPWRDLNEDASFTVMDPLIAMQHLCTDAPCWLKDNLKKAHRQGLYVAQC